MERINKLKEFLVASPDDSFLNHALALEYVKMEDDNAALKLFEAILTRDPGYVGSYYHLAKLYERMGSIEKAVEWYKRGMEAAWAAGDHHSLNEMRVAYEEMLD